MISDVKRPQAIAASIVCQGPAFIKMICKIAPVAAPVVKPKMSGEPRGLRDKD